uniref:Caffeic acid 3-O-methyltransferase-like protein n=1 Tax=Bixa orellana TaxID=66672 RepID=A0A9Y0ZGP7_BIXOR|nr:caffeic acid 3-O-methyltransferase-like protein [Bixa orellana]
MGVCKNCLQWILHDWGNDKCLTLLKNCFEALPEDGKVISVESVVPEFPSTDLVTQNVHKFDISMFQSIPGAKERTQEEFETLAKKAGFKSLRLVCRAHSYWVMELLKN